MSKARRACMTDKSSNFTADVKGMSAGATITKSYDTECVQNVLSGK